MTSRLAGKTAFVTAAGQGIGRAVALAFVREGARVIATDINTEALVTLAAETGCTTLKLDATDPAAITAAAAAQRGVNVLFNGAGYVHAGTVLECTEADWDFAFNLNVRSQFRLIKAFVPGMLEGGGGSIINVASVAGSIKGAPNRFVYGTTKAAIIGLTKAVAADFITKGIRPGQGQRPDARAGGSALHLAPAHGPPGARGRDRGPGRLPGQRRIGLHHRHRQRHRRRLVQLN
jgi:2-keto-3-deoxy-L-fuconate dehydrogenase